MRSGQQYVDGLRDSRTVFLDGEVVGDVVQHPAFAGVIGSLAAIYDTQEGLAEHFDELDADGRTIFAIPRSREDLRRRRDAIERTCRITHGWVGRGPEHVGAFLAGFAAAPQVFARERDLSGNVRKLYRRVVADDLYVTYAIIPPQASRTSASADDDLLQVGVVDEQPDGIVVRGSQMLGTGTAVSDLLLVSCIKPLTPGDERHAISFVLPLSADGLKVYCRRPYAPSAPSDFDYPLSTRFDEPDALVVFDDVFVPWEDVLVYRDVSGVREQFFSTPAHVLGNAQAQVRLAVKTQFLAGIAHKIVEINGLGRIPSVQEKLGELAALASSVEGMTLAAEAASIDHHSGAHIPNPRFLYGAMGLQNELYPRVLGVVRELAGGGVMQQPSSYRELTSAATKADIEHYLQAPGSDASTRVQLFKLAWDAVGSEYAGRHHQYEMFYAGAPFVVRGYAYRNYGYEHAVAAVEQFLESYGVPDGALTTAAGSR